MHLTVRGSCFLLLVVGACSDPTGPSGARIELSEASVGLWTRTTTRLHATVYDDSGHISIVPVDWTSADDSVATVDVTGSIFGVAPGRTTITASAGDVSATTVVTVRPETGGPELYGMFLSPASVELSGGYVEVTFSVVVEDRQSGVSMVDIYTRVLGNWIVGRCSAYSPEAGDASAGTWACRIAVNPYMESGEWTVSAVVWDRSGNFSEHTRTFAVTGSEPDPDAPRLAGVSIKPDTVRRGESFEVRVAVEDELSGVRGVRIFTTHGMCASHVSLGTPNYGTAVCEFLLPGDASATTVRVDMVELTDFRENVSEYTGEELEAAGHDVVAVVLE